MIPCEFCAIPVTPQLYMQHAHRCRQITHMEDVDSDNENQQLDCTLDDILISRIRNNYQVHRVNVRDFIQTHSRSPPTTGDYVSRNSHSGSPMRESTSYTNHTLLEYGHHITPKPKHVIHIEDVSFSVSCVPEENGEVCPICQTELREIIAQERHVYRLSKCLYIYIYIYCKQCITTWFTKKTTCPVCMTSV